MYIPSYVPKRFRSPEVYEVKVYEPLFPGPVYTIGYEATTGKGDADSLIFILNNGQGAWGAEWTGPGFTSKPITVDGVQGELYMIPGENSSSALKGMIYFRATWKKQGQGYMVIAISSRVTEVEFMKIAQSVVQLTK